jgi:hypothetical protein
MRLNLPELSVVPVDVIGLLSLPTELHVAVTVVVGNVPAGTSTVPVIVEVTKSGY